MNIKNLKIALLLALGLSFTASDSFADNSYWCCYTSPPQAPQPSENGYFCNDDPYSLASGSSSLPKNCCKVTENQLCPTSTYIGACVYDPS